MTGYRRGRRGRGAVTGSLLVLRENHPCPSVQNLSARRWIRGYSSRECKRDSVKQNQTCLCGKSKKLFSNKSNENKVLRAMNDKVHILGMAGSLRENSFNRALLHEATHLTPVDAEIEILELGGIPGFNQDEENDPPQKIKDLKQKVEEADAILFVTPEYNYSV